MTEDRDPDEVLAEDARTVLRDYPIAPPEPDARGLPTDVPIGNPEPDEDADTEGPQ